MSQPKLKNARKKIFLRKGIAYQTIRRERIIPFTFKARTPDAQHRKIASAIPNQQTLDHFLSLMAEGPERDGAFELIKPFLRFQAVNRLSKLDKGADETQPAA